MIFQGQEFLEDRWFEDTDPLDWSRVEKYNDIQTLYRDLIWLRRNCMEVTRGLLGPHVDVYHLDNKNKIIALHRWQDGGIDDSVVIVANFSNQALQNYSITLPADGKWIVRFNSDSQFYSEDFGNIGPAVVIPEQMADSSLVSATIDIGPYTVLIMSQSE